MPKRIFFIGHRNAPASLFPVLSDAIVRHAFLSENVELIIGQYGAFDRMAAKSALQLKKHRPSLHLTLLCPYHPSFRKIELPVGFDSLYYPFDRSIPPRAAIVAANIHMIETCDVLLFYVAHPGKSRDFLDYAKKTAQKKVLIIENLADTYIDHTSILRV